MFHDIYGLMCIHALSFKKTITSHSTKPQNFFCAACQLLTIDNRISCPFELVNLAQSPLFQNPGKEFLLTNLSEIASVYRILIEITPTVYTKKIRSRNTSGLTARFFWRVFQVAPCPRLKYLSGFSSWLTGRLFDFQPVSKRPKCPEAHFRVLCQAISVFRFNFLGRHSRSVQWLRYEI